MTPEQAIRHLRRANEVARRARDAMGKHPFGAILVDEQGRVLMEQENAFDTEGRTGHAETVLSRRACAAFTAAATDVGCGAPSGHASVACQVDRVRKVQGSGMPLQPSPHQTMNSS